MNSPSTAANSERLGIALVGLGYYSEHRLAPALQETKHCYLAGIVTGSSAKAARWKTKYNLSDNNIYNYESFDRIVGNKDIDVVYIVLPNALHHDYVIRAAKAGKHVLCEKPMALSVKECEEMIEACRTANVKLSIGYRLRFEPFNQEAMRVGQQQAFGKVKFIESGFGFKIGDPAQWRLRKELSGGGALMDLGIYAIQAARYVTGKEPVSVTAQEFKTDPVKFNDVDETVFWQMEFPGGVVSSSTTSYAADVERLYIAAENGWLLLEPCYAYGPFSGKTHNGNLNLPQVNHQALQLDDFAFCILENRESRISGEEGLKDLKVIEAIYKAIQTGRKANV